MAFRAATEVEATVSKLKNRKPADKDVIRDMIKGEGDMVVDGIWRLCNVL